MKIDKSTALFLTKVLFHYEQLVKESLSSDNNLADRVRVLRGELSDNLLAEDKCPNCIQEDEVKEEEEEKENHIEYDYPISKSELVALSSVKIRNCSYRLYFTLSASDNDGNRTLDTWLDNCRESEDVAYVIRRGNRIQFLHHDDLNNPYYVQSTENWWGHDVSKFPPDWIDMLEAGLVYKCV